MYQKSKSDRSSKQLFILNGELRGVSVPLATEQIRLGSSADCDVVLLDESDENSEVLITPNEADGTYAFEAIAGKVRIGRRNLKVGNTKPISDGVPIVVGNVKVALGASLESAEKTNGSFRRRSVGVLCAASVALGLGLLGFLTLSGGPAEVVAQSTAAPQITYVLDQSGRSQSMVAAKELQRRVDEFGLKGLVIAGDQDEHMVRVNGKMRDSDRTRWLDTVEWFDQSFGRSVSLDAKIATMENEIVLPFSIEAVWAGNAPRVTLHDGSKRTIGDELPGGWVLDAVALESVKISKDDETLDVAL